MEKMEKENIQPNVNYNFPLPFYMMNPNPMIFQQNELGKNEKSNLFKVSINRNYCFSS